MPSHRCPACELGNHDDCRYAEGYGWCFCETCWVDEESTEDEEEAG